MNPDPKPTPSRTIDYRPPCAERHPLVFVLLDEHLAVIDKPSGLLSVPGRGPERADCAWSRLTGAGVSDALVVHRLDMATSGLLLFARGPDMQRRLSQAFADRRVHKTYTALVSGHLREDAGEVDLPLICDWPNRPRQKVDLHMGKRALTRWQVTARGESDQPWTRVQLEPVTGRSHQLRVHMLALGHPILGDDLYGPTSGAQPVSRLMLHAQEVRLEHPAGEHPLVLHCAAPF